MKLLIGGKFLAITIAIFLSGFLSGCFENSAESFLVAAKKELENKNNVAAVVQLKNALQKNPQMAEARYILGKVLLDLGDLNGAEIELKKASDLGYSDNEIAPLQAKVLLQQAEFDQVLRRFADVNLSDLKARAELQSLLASAYAAKGDYKAANAAVKVALDSDPSNVFAQLTSIRLIGSTEGFDAAISAVNKAIEKWPKSAAAWQLKGELIVATGMNNLAAIAAFEEALKLNPSDVAVHAQLVGQLLEERNLPAAEKQLEALRVKHPGHIRWRMLAVALAMDKGDLKAASEHSQVLLKMAPDDGRLQYLGGLIAFRQGAFRDAEGLFKKALANLGGAAKVRLFLAQTYLRLGEPAKTVQVLSPLFDSKQALPALAYASMAEAKLQLGEFAKAEELYSKAAKLNPKDVRSRTALAVAQIDKGRTAQGLEELRAVSEFDTGAVADLAMISAYMQRSDWTNSLAAIARLEGKLPKAAYVPHLRGQVEIRKENVENARAAFEAALKLEPLYFPAVASLASMDVVEGKTELARKRLEKLTAADPKNVKAAMSLVNLVASLGASKAEQRDILLRAIGSNPSEDVPRLALIALQLEAKEFKQAVVTAQDGVVAMPESSDLLEALALAQFRSGDTNQAVSIYNKVLALHPNSPRTLVGLADVYIAQKQFQLANTVLRKAAFGKLNYLPAQQGLIELELKMGHLKEALSTAKLIQAQRTDGFGESVEGDLESGQKNWTKAAAAYRAAIDKKPSSALVIKLHKVLKNDGKSNEARLLQEQWLKKFPRDASFLFYLGELSLQAQDYADALQKFAAVNKILPTDAVAMNNMAWVMNKLKKPGALEFALKATKARPHEPSFLDTLAEIYQADGQMAKAIEAQKAAVLAGPDIHTHRLHLARLYVQAGEKPSAKLELDRLAGLGAGFAGQTEVKALQAKL
jgi:putative PEP-CTERM system TPR-repeat lipoprotein